MYKNSITNHLSHKLKENTKPYCVTIAMFRFARIRAYLPPGIKAAARPRKCSGKLFLSQLIHHKTLSILVQIKSWVFLRVNIHKFGRT